MTAKSEYEPLKSASALCYFGHLFLTVSGDKPTPCHRVRVVESPLDIWPPEFIVTFENTAELCVQQVVPYQTTQFFWVNDCPSSITVRAYGTTLTVDVKNTEHHKELAGALQIAGGEIPTPFLEKLEKRPRGGNIATGMSTASFEDAYRKALKYLSSAPPPYPDALASIRVVEQGGLHGGLKGFDHFVVTIERKWT